MPDSRLVRNEIFPESIEHFRAFMQKLAVRHGHKWMSANNEQVIFDEYRQINKDVETPPTRDTWQVHSIETNGKGIRGYAAIEAYEDRPQHTEVDFLDGYYPGLPGRPYPPIGAAFKEFCEMIIREMRSLVPAEDNVGKRHWGRPGLPREELIYRLAKAQEGEELKRANPDMVWKEIAREIQWRLGTDKAGIKLLEDARHRLHRLEKNDPHGLLEEVAQWRQRKQRKER